MRERACVLVTVCNFYLSELGGLYCEFFSLFFSFSFSFVVVEGTCWSPVAVWPRSFRSQPDSPWVGTWRDSGFGETAPVPPPH